MSNLERPISEAHKLSYRFESYFDNNNIGWVIKETQKAATLSEAETDHKLIKTLLHGAIIRWGGSHKTMAAY